MPSTEEMSYSGPLISFCHLQLISQLRFVQLVLELTDQTHAYHLFSKI